MKARLLCTWLTALTTVVAIGAAGVLATAPSATAMAAAARSMPALPLHLRDTGLYVPGSRDAVRPQVLAFAPQYTLWSDGAEKRRWLFLPPGSRIDASRADAWQFPVGTRLWKEFSHQGRKVETRFIERLADGQWRYAAYIWNEDGSDAVLAPEAGAAGLPVAQAPGGRYDVPSRADCVACHGGAAVPVLGFSALQLSADRDPLAVHALPASVTLPDLVARGLLRKLPPALLAQPPRITAASPVERAALGYLHANCAHCHNHNGTPVPVRLTLVQTAEAAGDSLQRVRASTVGATSRYRPPGAAAPTQVIVAGDPQASVLALRMRSRHPQVQMPPIGTRLPDSEGLALIERWITSELPTLQEKQP